MTTLTFWHVVGAVIVAQGITGFLNALGTLMGAMWKERKQ